MAPLRKTCPSSAQRLFQTGTPRCRSRWRSVPADSAAKAPPTVAARRRYREPAVAVNRLRSGRPNVALLVTGFEAFVFIALVIVALIAIGALFVVFLKADDRRRARNQAVVA